MRRNARTILALDLGSSTFKGVVVELAGPSDRPRLIRAKVEPVTPAAVDPAAAHAALVALLHDLPHDEQTDVVSLIHDPYACFRTLVLPVMPSHELVGAVRWDLQQYVAIPVEEMIVDSRVIGDVEHDGIRKWKVAAAAAPATTVRHHVALLTQAGVPPMRLVPQATAVASWWAPRPPGSATALLVLGHQSSEFLVVQDGQVVLTRNIPVAGGEMTAGMTGVLMTPQGQVGLSLAEAEQVKCRSGIPSSTSAEIVASGISGAQILGLIRAPLERLATEVESSMGFYTESAAGVPITEVILVGGGAHLKGLTAWLGERLGVRVTAPEPLDRFAVAADAMDDQAAAVALSLAPALGAALSAEDSVNLLPPELQRVAHRHVRRAVTTGALTAVILTALLLRIGLGLGHYSLAAQIGALRAEQAATTVDAAQARAAAAAHDRVLQEPAWEELFRALSIIVPEEISLISLTIHDRDMVLRGRVRERTRSADISLAAFMRALSDGSMGQVTLGQVTLGSSHRLDQPAHTTEFEVRCVIR